MDTNSQFATNVYYDRTFDCDAAKILPGEYYYTGKEHADRDRARLLRLGLHPRPRHGPGRHEPLHAAGRRRPGSPVSASMRYGSYAMEVLINDLLKAGARREHLEAKVFGGGAVLRGFSAMNVGERNAAFVINFLKTERIPVLAEDLNDIYPRKVYFFPRTGKVLVKKLMQTHNDTLAKRELDYASRLKVAPVGGAIDLF
jgi:chemotaxis protein CheD